MAVLLRHALRRLHRRKGYFALNVAGLALGLATCAVLLLFVRHEMRYDAHHPHAERTGLLVAQAPMVGGEPRVYDHLPVPLADDLLDVLPAVERAVRVREAGTLLVRVDGEAGLLEEGNAYADPEVFDVFALPLLAGDSATALEDTDAIVLDEDVARRLFGAPAEAALGREFEVGGRLVRVTGVMAPVPATTHWRPRVLLPREAGEADFGGWGNPYHTFMHRIYVRFQEGADPEAALGQAPAALAARVEGSSLAEATFAVQPLRRIHLHGESPWGYASDFSLAEISRMARLRVFTAVALLILLLAGVNYVNLATAYGLRQAREVGVRKTLGAGRAQVASLFLVEAVALALAAGALALTIIPLALPFFNEAVQTEVRFLPWQEPGLVVAALGLALGVGLLAGAYPALALSRPSPATVFRSGAAAGAGGAGVRRGLVVFQFAVAVLLVASTLVMGQQVAYMQEERLGLEPEQVLAVELEWAQGGNPRPALEDRLRRHPAIIETAAATGYPGGSGGGFSSFRTSEDEATVWVYTLNASEALRGVLGMELVAGTDIGAGPHPEDAQPILINEAAAAARGWTPQEAVGEPFPLPGSGVVAGVVRDFQYGSFRARIHPAMIRPLAPESHGSVLMVRFRPGQTAEALRAVEAAWAEAAPGAPLRTRFVDEQFAELFTAERRLAGLFSAFAGLAVLIACLGLFGLAAYAAEQRRKEIGIRKVLGAHVGGLVALLSREFVVLVAVAFAVAVPLAYWATGRWLEGFVYRVALGPGVFLGAGALALLMALLAVGFHALRAATADPVRALRSE